MHAEKQIRDAITALLQTMPTAGANVGDSVWPIPPEKLPHVRALFRGEDIPPEEQVFGPETFRIATYELEIRVKGQDYQDQIATIRGEIETVMAADISLGLGDGVCARLIGAGPGIYEDEADEARAFIPVVYQVEYRTLANDPGTLIQ